MQNSFIIGYNTINRYNLVWDTIVKLEILLNNSNEMINSSLEYLENPERQFVKKKKTTIADVLHIYRKLVHISYLLKISARQCAFSSLKVKVYRYVYIYKESYIRYKQLR